LGSVLMNAYLRNIWVRVGLFLVLIGWGPFLIIFFLWAVGLWSDANPNPVGPGLLLFVTFWPAVFCLVVGFVQVTRGHQGSSSSTERPPKGFSWRGVSRSPLVRLLAGMIGLGLVAYAMKNLFNVAEGRGPGAALILGVAVLHYAVRGKISEWHRRRF